MKKKFKKNILILLVKAKNYFLSFFSINTVGAQALVIKDNEILLVKHSYAHQWYTIGGGLKKNESFEECIARELKEEVGLTLVDRPVLFNIYHNKFHGRNDYVALYLVTEFNIQKIKSFEIEETRWFSLNELPHDISAATLRRVHEYLKLAEPNGHW